MVVVAIPAEEVRVVAVLQDELLAAEVGVAEADPGAALHADGVHPVHEASVLEVLAVPEDLQLPAREVLALVQRDLGRPGRGARGHGLLSTPFQGQTPGGAPTPSTEPQLPGSLKPRPAAHGRCPSLSADDSVTRRPALPAWELAGADRFQKSCGQRGPPCPGAHLKTGSFQTPTADLKLGFGLLLKRNVKEMF